MSCRFKTNGGWKGVEDHNGRGSTRIVYILNDLFWRVENKSKVTMNENDVVI